jgi:hypothetical protein
MKIEETNYDIDLLLVLLWQYEEAENLTSLVVNKNIWLAIYGTLFWQAWYFTVFDLRTANLFGLTIWSILLDLPLFVPTASPNPAAPVWGFNELPFPTVNDNVNFGHGNLSGALVIPTLTEDEQRIALQLKYYQLVSRGAVTEVNQFLNYLFGDQGGAWMIDNFDMTITYEFGFTINPVLLNVIASYELLPKPAGVSVNYIVPP